MIRMGGNLLWKGTIAMFLSSPMEISFVPSWHLGKPTKDSAIQEGPASNVPQ